MRSRGKKERAAEMNRGSEGDKKKGMTEEKIKLSGEGEEER